MVKAPIFAISRLRMKTDGNGITTLVAFMGCPLRCKYCLNEQCHQFIYEEDGIKPRNGVILLSAQDLYDKVKIDNIYFQATGGGICFGGIQTTLRGKMESYIRNVSMLYCKHNKKIKQSR